MNALISQIFGEEKIYLDCPLSGQCIHKSELPGYQPPEIPPFSLLTILVMTCSALGLVGLLLFGLSALKRMQNAGMEEIRPLLEEEQAEQENHLMAAHEACTLSFKDISYFIEKRRQYFPKSYSTRYVRADSSASLDAVIQDTQSTTTSHNLSDNQAESQSRVQVLENISGVIKPGEVMAIMGGSGAGKTTFLDILAQKNKKGVTTGELRVNGQVMSRADYNSIIG